MTNSEEIYEFNKIDAYNKLKEAINYITGKDREQDFKKFMILCKTSALQGNSHAQYILGIFFEEGILGLERYFETTINTDEKYYEMINPKTALKWYKKSARGNYKEAQYAAANMYFKGIGVKTDYEKALYYFKSSKTEYACFYVGYIYEKGLGVKQDYKTALKWYEKSANMGNSNSSYNLGVMYKMGQGTDVDFEKAISWYENAAKKDNENALCNLAMMYRFGEGVEVDYEKAVKLYEKAAKLGSETAICQMGYMYNQGLGVEQDYEKAK